MGEKRMAMRHVCLLEVGMCGRTLLSGHLAQTRDEMREEAIGSQQEMNQIYVIEIEEENHATSL
jgi:hypothetical protein